MVSFAHFRGVDPDLYRVTAMRIQASRVDAVLDVGCRCFESLRASGLAATRGTGVIRWHRSIMVVFTVRLFSMADLQVICDSSDRARCPPI